MLLHFYYNKPRGVSESLGTRSKSFNERCHSFSKYNRRFLYDSISAFRRNSVSSKWYYAND